MHFCKLIHNDSTFLFYFAMEIYICQVSRLLYAKYADLTSIEILRLVGMDQVNMK